MKEFITPNDDGIRAESDSLSIQNAVDEAVRSDIRRVVIPRINQRRGAALWEIERAILLPSNIEIVLDNCYLRQADGAMDNVFRNFEHGYPRRTLAEEQENIVIRGVGNAVIDGGVHNGLTQQNSCKDGMPHVERNNVILLHNLRGFKLQDFTIKNQRWWAINLKYVEEGLISGLKIVCDGNYHNQDGIDLRLGCNDIILENLVGQAGDDFIALTGLCGREYNEYSVDGKSVDIHDIVIKNIVATSAECTVVALRNQDGLKIYNITIDSIHDAISSRELKNEHPCFVFNFDNNSYKSPKSPYSTIRIGQRGWVTRQPCALGDTSRIRISNIHTRVGSAVLINESLSDSYIGNLYVDSEADRAITTRSCRTHQAYGADLRNVVFENIFYPSKGNPEAIAFDFDAGDQAHTLENVIVRNAFIGEAVAVKCTHRGTLTVNGLYADAEPKVVTGEGCRVIIDGRTVN